MDRNFQVGDVVTLRPACRICSRILGLGLA
jgi:hypothetical protein